MNLDLVVYPNIGVNNMDILSRPQWYGKAESYYEFQKQRSSWTQTVPEITFVLLLCKGIRKRIPIEEIAAQAIVTYPKHFYTKVEGKKIPDLALVL